ncbi:unannotated protein [freshwater metagenome]|uniref:Unannotated protein n=1 Tax=freshwater metagenome TaxID=449393 RepID=A0A6J6JQ59_9ZZZZ
MIAKPIRCVKETFPPRVLERCELITRRLSIISLAGSARTLVAVGIWIDWSMLVARVLAIPLRAVIWSCASSSDDSGTIAIDSVIGACAGIGAGFASTRVVFATTGIDEVISETTGA